MANASPTDLEQLRLRWAGTAIGNPRAGVSVNISHSPFGRVPDSGMEDFRGLCSHARLPGEHAWASDGTPPMLAIRLERSHFSQADFSYAHLESAHIDHCHFENCVFCRSNLAASVMLASHFSWTIFDAVDFRRAGIGTLGGTFTNCDFIAPRMADTLFSTPRFVDCRFLKCNLRRVYFEGASFTRVTFSGKVHGCWFRGKFPPDLETLFGPAPGNPMDHVSFRDCELRGLHTTDGCNLSTIILPEHGHYVVLPHIAAIADWVRHELLAAHGTNEDKELRNFLEVVATDRGSTNCLFAREDFIGSKHYQGSGARIWNALCSLPGVRLSREAALSDPATIKLAPPLD